MKAILVIDEMPTRCLDCPLIWDEMNNDIVRCSNGRRLDDNDEYIYKQKPSWCPLKPMPQKGNFEIADDHPFTKAEIMAYTYGITVGRNQVIDEITE